MVVLVDALRDDGRRWSGLVGDEVVMSLVREVRLETRVGQGCCCCKEGDDRDVNFRWLLGVAGTLGVSGEEGEAVVLPLLRRETDMDKCGSFLVLDARKTLAAVCLLLLFPVTGGVVFSFSVGGTVMVERRVVRLDTDGARSGVQDRLRLRSRRGVPDFRLLFPQTVLTETRCGRVVGEVKVIRRASCTSLSASAMSSE